MKEFIELLNEIRPDVDFESITDLVSSGVLKSHDIIRIVGMIDDEYDVKIPVSELKLENFDSAQAMYDLIQRIDD